MKSIKDVQVEIDLAEIKRKKSPLAKKPTKVEIAASKYVALKEQISDMEFECKALSELLKTRAYKGEQDGNTFTANVGRFKLVVTKTSREGFDLKKARTTIKEELLSPFIKISDYSTLRVKAVK